MIYDMMPCCLLLPTQEVLTKSLGQGATFQ
jgi:hypothetical protein